MRNKTKKIIALILVSIYWLSNFLQNWLYIWDTVYAAPSQEDQIEYTNIVAIIVNDKIYNQIKNDVEWYATNYIQWAWDNQYTAISNSKALVFPVNTDNFSAKNITQLLENIYFDGISGEPSRLVWVILIWDIPLPVVNQDWYIFPTIYPYVDFEEQKFIWDESSKYFVYNNNPNWQAEIWHWMINFDDNIDEYSAYFDKIRSYLDNPSEYIWKAIWYDDFIWNNKYFNDNSLNFYLNNFLFAEDLGYHRYSDLMIKVLQWQRNQEIADIMTELNDAMIDLWSSGFDLTNLDALSDDINTPTMQIKAIIDNGYLSSYSSLFGQKYLKTITNNIQTANRWIESRTWSDWTNTYWNALDTHYTKLELTDETSLRTNGWVEPFLIMLNNALEEAVDTKVEQEKYWLNEVIPLTYLKYEWESRRNWKCVRNIYDAYENYFFWRKARFIQSMEDTTTYRWTFRNYSAIDGLTIQNIQNSENPSTDISSLDLNKKSIWWSYEIFATQIDANRWYNYNNSIAEYEIYSWNKTAKMENWDVTCVSRFLWICRKRRRSISHTNWSWCDLSENWDQWGCEDPQEYATRIRWWASPLNLQSSWSEFTWKSGYSYTGAVNEVFDIAGSTNLTNPEYESNSFESVEKYSNLTLRKFSPDTSRPKFKAWNPMKKAPDTYWFGYDYSMDYDVKFTNKIPTFDSNSINGRIDANPKNANDVDFFENYNNSAHKEWNIIKITKANAWWDPSCQWAGEIYTYKTLDSRVKNNSVNEDEINWYDYEIFNDNRSHVKQFYEELSTLIDAISGTVNAIVWDDTGSLVNKLSYIKEKIDDINHWFESIIDFNTSNLSNFTTWQIDALANVWLNTFDSNSIDDLYTNIKEAQDLVLTLSWFVDIWENLFDGVIDFIDKEKESFQVNWWDLIFLNDRKDNIYETIKDTLENYENLKSIITESNIVYQTINDLWNEDIGWIPTPISMNIISEISNKKDELSQLLNWSWCETRYSNLCDTLDVLMDNYISNAENINDEKYEINNPKVQQLDDNRNPIAWAYDEINNILWHLLLNVIFDEINNIKNNIINIGLSAAMISIWIPILVPPVNEDDPLDILFHSIYDIPWTWNENLTGFVEWMNITTSDRPIDSPRYLTFKWIWWDKVTFIYPDLYKAEIFSGDSDDGLLTLKTPSEIKIAIQEYLKAVVRKYNSYLSNEILNRNNYYNQNQSAFNTLDEIDPLANPYHFHDTDRPYQFFDENYLIERLEISIQNSPYFSGEDFATNDPIWFIADMIYYQNISRQKKTIWTTIQEDLDKQRTDFDINEKISYILDNYLISDNNKGKFLTPDYRDDWYEVAFINSDWNDYISYEVSIPIVDTISNFASNYEQPTIYDEDKTLFEQQLISECNIPEEWWVLIFDISNWHIETPRFEALKCRWEKTKEKPFEFKITFPFSRNDWSWFWDNLWNVFNLDDYENIGNFYINQIQLLDTDDINDEIINNIDLWNPWDAAKLQEILSYTIIKPTKTSVSADNATTEIEITSSFDNGNIDFHIINIWESQISISDWDSVLSDDITILDAGYNTWKITFNPYEWKVLTITAENSKEWLNVIEFYMCLPWTQNLSNCVRHTNRLDIVPWDIKNVSIQIEDHIVLEWSSLPFSVKWTDQYGNDVWELITKKFETSSSSGNLTLNWVTSESIKFSNFDKSNFSLNATWWNLDKKTITLQVSWTIDEINGIHAEDRVLVKKWRIDTFSGWLKLASGSDIITWLNIKLPDKNIYTATDTYWLTQYQTWNLPQLELRLIDTDWNLIDIAWQITIRTKNNYLKPWWIETRNISKNINWENIEVTQYNFGKSNYFNLSWWICTVYLLPSFSAGNDIIYISMPWIDDIQIPVHIYTASPKIVSLSADGDNIDTNSTTHANLKIFDNRNNLVDENISVILKSTNNKITLSSSGTLTINSWSFDFDIFSNDKWWSAFIYAYIDTNTVPLTQQKPDTLMLTVQQKMLPENDLNIMYLNLFGNDRWNQWWYMSDNEKYSESLIQNSDKLITITTQLVDLENIKYFPIVIDNTLQINNLIGNDITVSLSDNLVFDVKSVGEIKATINWLKLEEARISEDVIDQYISAQMSGSDRWKNILFYIPEQTDSIIQENEVRNSALYINNEKVFDLRDNTFDQNLTISLSSQTIAGYQVWQIYFQWTFAGKILIAIDNKSEISM